MTFIHAPDERLYPATADPEVTARHVARYRTAIELANKKGGIWLDCACGTGYGAALIHEHAKAAVWGVDRDPSAIDYADRHYENPVVHFQRWTIEELLAGYALDGERFDVIVSIETLEHLPERLQRPWVEWCRAHLKPYADACLVLACPVGDGPNPRNPHHLHEPRLLDLIGYCDAFRRVRWRTERYESTSGPARQAFVWCAR